MAMEHTAKSISSRDSMILTRCRDIRCYMRNLQHARKYGLVLVLCLVTTLSRILIIFSRVCMNCTSIVGIQGYLNGQTLRFPAQ
jgi:hypothetical protein